MSIDKRALDKSQAPCGVEWTVPSPADCIYCENERIIVTTEIRQYITAEMALAAPALKDFIGELHSVEYGYAKCPACTSPELTISGQITTAVTPSTALKVTNENTGPVEENRLCDCSHTEGSHYNGEKGCFQCPCTGFQQTIDGLTIGAGCYAGQGYK